MLTGLGLPLDTLHTLEAERTLALQLEGLPDLMLSLVDGELWFWSLLQKLSTNKLMDYAPAALTQLIIPVEGIQG
ncbi:InvB/SpaK family type III secretion system chaperone, partial [Aeromonas veronii]